LLGMLVTMVRGETVAQQLSPFATDCKPELR